MVFVHDVSVHGCVCVYVYSSSFFSLFQRLGAWHIRLAIVVNLFCAFHPKIITDSANYEFVCRLYIFCCCRQPFQRWFTGLSSETWRFTNDSPCDNQQNKRPVFCFVHFFSPLLFGYFVHGEFIFYRDWRSRRRFNNMVY